MFLLIYNDSGEFIAGYTIGSSLLFRDIDMFFIRSISSLLPRKQEDVVVSSSSLSPCSLDQFWILVATWDEIGGGGMGGGGLFSFEMIAYPLYTT